MILATFPVAGLQYHAGIAYADAINENDELQLVREPTNAHDSQAVMVFHMGIQLGYLPRPVNQIALALKVAGWEITAEAEHSGSANVVLKGEPA